MAKTVADVMTGDPATIERGESAADLAVERDEDSALADISAAAGNL